MKMLGWAVAVLLIGSGVAGAAPRGASVDARLRLEVDMRRERGDAAATVPFFARALEPQAAAEAIGRAGGVVDTRAGDILTVRAPADRVAEIAAIPGMLRLEGAVRMRKRLDAARTLTGVDKAHTGAAPLAGTYTGKGVVVGVVDGGLDLSHAAFRNGAGKSRVLALWDQVASGTPPQGLSYGKLCDAPTLAADGCNHVADDAHGTHVTGIAAGGVVGDSPFTGMAPDAAIVFVNNAEQLAGKEDQTDAGFSTAVCDAAAWIFQNAAGKPTVVNMSLGTHEGPHDGSSLASQCLDNLVGPGKIIVAAAGNEGEGSSTAGGEAVAVHAKGNATAEGTSVAFAVGGKDDVQFTMAIWGRPSAKLAVRIGVVGKSSEVTTALVQAPDGASNATLKVDGKTLGPIRIYAESGEADQHGVIVQIEDDNGDKAERAAQWFVEVQGSGGFDAFIDTTASEGFVQSQDNGATIDNLSTVGFPAIASGVIAVGAYTSKSGWTDASGNARTAEPEANGKVPTVGALAAFSSRGPSLDPARTGHKPDLAGPGQMVVAALAHAAQADAGNVVVQGPSGYVAEQGTSMASPAVAGIVALLLQAQPTLDVGAVRKLLTETTDREGIGAALPDIGWGHGRVDAFAALQELDAASGGSGAGTGSGEPSGGGGPVPGGGDGAGDDLGSDFAGDDGCQSGSHGRAVWGWLVVAVAAVLGLSLWRRRRDEEA